MIRSTEDLLSCATLYPLDAAIDEANTRRDILIAKMKEVIRERGELDCELLLTATMSRQSTREKRIQLIKYLKAALLSRSAQNIVRCREKATQADMEPDLLPTTTVQS